jgi:hypothetical protein
MIIYISHGQLENQIFKKSSCRPYIVGGQNQGRKTKFAFPLYTVETGTKFCSRFHCIQGKRKFRFSSLAKMRTCAKGLVDFSPKYRYYYSGKRYYILETVEGRIWELRRVGHDWYTCIINFIFFLLRIILWTFHFTESDIGYTFYFSAFCNE